MTWDLRPPHSGNARPRVLCVDDEPVILQILRRLLEVQGFEPVTCGDPVAAIALFDHDSFDVVITDLHMPGMDGLSLMRALRERQPELPVMVVTGHGTVDTAIQALREGANGMLVKPFTGEELLGEVRRALAASQMRYEAMQYRYLSPVLDSIALTSFDRDRGPQPGDGRALPAAGCALRTGRRGPWPRWATAYDGPHRRVPPRHRQDRHRRRDPSQAGPPHG